MPSVWERYDKEQQDEYKDFIRMYGALSSMFNQKSNTTGKPYLDSKFQETMYARCFNADAVDIGNTPHDMRSTFAGKSIGIGIKTWLDSSPSFQKVMQLKALKSDIEKHMGNEEDLANTLADIKNDKLITDYNRLNLQDEGNIYHYVTRDKGKLVIQETAYPLVDKTRLDNFKFNEKNGKRTSFEFSDGLKHYKYTFGDCEIWMKFGDKNDHTLIDQVDVEIMDDPFKFLKDAFVSEKGIIVPKAEPTDDSVYLPLYSYSKQLVPERSGVNAWHGAPKVKGSGKPRPEREVYIPIPREFHKKNPTWFGPNALETTEKNIEFNLHMPDGKVFPAGVRQAGLKSFQTNPQSALGKWLLDKVLNLPEGQIVTKDWLDKKGFDSVRIWHIDGDLNEIGIDFAPTGSFERFMHDKDQDVDEEDLAEE